MALARACSKWSIFFRLTLLLRGWEVGWLLTWWAWEHIKTLQPAFARRFRYKKKGSTMLFSLITIISVKKSALCEKKRNPFFGRKNSRLQLNFHWGEALPCCFVRCISPNEWHFKEVCKILAPYLFHLKKFYFLSRSFQIQRKEIKKVRLFQKGLKIFFHIQNEIHFCKYLSVRMYNFKSKPYRPTCPKKPLACLVPSTSSVTSSDLSTKC